MRRAKNKFSPKPRKVNRKKEGLSSAENRDSIKNEENELLATDNEAGAPAMSSMFEPVEIEDNVDYTDGGEI